MGKVVKIAEVFGKIKAAIGGYMLNEAENRVVVDVTADSRKVTTGSLFVAVKGVTKDGHMFIEDAIKAGANAIIISNPEVEVKEKLPILIVEDSREALVLALKEFYGPQPDEVIGVTGTNGKTTVTHMLHRIMNDAGVKTGVIGTLGFMFEEGKLEKLPITTPDAETIWKLFSSMREKGIKAVAMEVSSHGLHQKRVWGIDFSKAIFTNLSQDHLDYHGDMKAYLAAKCILFSQLRGDSVAVVNVDDPACDEVIKANRGKLLTYGIESARCDVKATVKRLSIDGSKFEVNSPWGRFDLQINVPGKFNVYNALASFASALVDELPPEKVISSLAAFKGVRGRFEKVELGQPFTVVVDYAHTPEALKNLITAARKLTRGRVIVVFGAGGDRDKLKRPIMGEVATKYADYVVITSDNPRTEDPEKIIDMIIEGVCRDNWIRIVDRRKAIFHAIENAKAGDIVLIAGKGHEDYQIIGDKIIHFDDVEVARDAIKAFWGVNDEG